MKPDPISSPRDDAVTLLAAAVVAPMQRALSLVDESPRSSTYGCADRTYWYYRTLTNFPGATWQQLMLAFACLYRAGHSANPYFEEPRIASLAAGLLTFWCRTQHRDGSFDEWYRNERSYCPTAITSAGAALTIHLLGDALPTSARSAGLRSLERAGRWLEKRYNTEVMNQNLAAAAALQALAFFMPDSRWSAAAGAKLDHVRRCQTSEGWFPEYAGMDLGYSSLALDLLAVCSVFGGGTVVAEMAKRLSAFLLSAHGAGASVAGRLGSRGTGHAFPFGAMFFGPADASAARLAERSLAGIASRLVPLPESVDDRYFAYFYLPQFALAYHHAATAPVAASPAAEPAQGCIEMPESGFSVRHGGTWSVAVSSRLGGAVAVQTSGATPLYHLGYEAILSSGKCYSSAVWARTGSESVAKARQSMPIRTEFRAVSGGVPLRRWMVPFQLVVQMLWSSSIAAALQSLIKRVMIAPDVTCPLTLERLVKVEADKVTILDNLIPGPGLGRLSGLRLAETISMHSPSGRQDPAIDYTANADTLNQSIELLNRGAVASLCWTWLEGSEAPTLLPGSGTRQ